MKEHSERYPELDLIRFIAAASVLVYHYKSKYIASIGADTVLAHSIYSVTKFGYLGVDLFFMISGFVIFASALGRSGFEFAVSRATRIYPTFWVCMSMTALVVWLLDGPASGITWKQWFVNLTLLSEYLGENKIDGVYWTLVVELKFYVCVFALIITGLIGQYRWWLPAWLLAACTFRFFHQPFFMGWFISPEYSAYFISGILFYLIRRDGPRPFHFVLLAPALALACLNAYSVIDNFSGQITTFDRVLAALIVCAIHLVFLLIALRRLTLRSSAFVLTLGGLTYPIYLLHNRLGKSVYDAAAGYVAPLLLVVGVTALVLALAWVVHVYLERGIADPLKRSLFAAHARARAFRTPRKQPS
jgi:peptidoglycan/LPS O-acetylase OafA/YrhL